MKRVLALVAAVAMVVGAFVVRSKVIDDSKSGSSRRSGTPSSGTRLTIACAPELTDVCDAVQGGDIRVLSKPLDVHDAAAAAPNIDAWLTYGPAPAIVNADAADQQKVYEAGTVVASARLAVVAPDDRVAALNKYCRAAKLTWSCLVRAAGLSWSAVAPNDARLQGTVKVGVGNPSSALGSILTGPLALATANQSDPGIDDIDSKAVERVVSSVDQAPPDDELTDLTIQGPAAFSAVVAPEGSARRAAASTRGQGLGLVVIYPEPVATTVVVLAAPSGRQVPQAVTDAFNGPGARRALLSAGWTPTSRGTTTGLPAPDVLSALRQVIAS